MKPARKTPFPGPSNVFHERRLPERAAPAGYGALIAAYKLAVPLPRTLSAIGKRHKVVVGNDWRILTPRHAPPATLEGHLTFALKYEGVDLAVLKRLFEAVGANAIANLVKAKPTGSYARRLWFLFEWLGGNRLNLSDASSGAYVPVLDPHQQWPAAGKNSARHRVRNNLPGTPAFCPLVFRTKLLEQYVEANLSERARRIVAGIPRDLLARAASFLLLKDSRSSYAIEGERPAQDRIQRWGRAIGEAGRRTLDEGELLRLQTIVIGDARFVKLGLRQEGGFVGEHDRQTQAPLPDHISARPQALGSLIGGLIAFDQSAAQSMDAVIAAAILAFGFVYIHPFEDGNGRIHRYLIHHALQQRGFNPPGVIFPISSTIMARIDEYRRTLEEYSKSLLPLVKWEATKKFNIRVLNDTDDYYRFFDATPHAEFLYACVCKTIEEDLPDEVAFLRRHDQFRAGVESVIDLPERTLGLLFHFLSQNQGKLSTRARGHEFKKLTETEATQIEELYGALFGSGSR